MGGCELRGSQGAAHRAPPARAAAAAVPRRLPSPTALASLLPSLAPQTSLCVRRAVYVDPETGKEDPAKKVGRA